MGLMASLRLAGAWARADFINFDPDGGNNPNGTGSLPATTINGFDQAVGNMLALGGNAAIANGLGLASLFSYGWQRKRQQSA